MNLGSDRPGKVSWGKTYYTPVISNRWINRFFFISQYCFPERDRFFVRESPVIYFWIRGKKLSTICPQKKIKNVDKKILNIFCYIG
jgi:hypothetical protein